MTGNCLAKRALRNVDTRPTKTIPAASAICEMDGLCMSWGSSMSGRHASDCMTRGQNGAGSGVAGPNEWKGLPRPELAA